MITEPLSPRDSWAALARLPVRWLYPAGESRWARTLLLAVAVAAGVLYGWHATGNLEIYYAAGVRSMSMSWHDFLYAAFDPRGTISLDKLPGAFWVQALSARVFGFSAAAIVAPQVAEGVLTVFVLFRAVRRLAGPWAGVTAAAVLAVAPATVTLNRGNISDTLLVLLLVLAADATVSALLTASARSAVIAGIWVGLAFQAKMLEAWLVLPAFGATLLLCSRGSLARRAAQLAAMVTVAVVVSLSWLSVVSLLPKHGRPYVDGSPNDSLFHQVFVYNGFGRLHQDSPNRLLNQAIGTHIALSGPGSWNRFLSGADGRDTGWLIPAAIAILVLCLIGLRRAKRDDPLLACLVLWGTWLAVFLVALSFDSSINSYYAAVFSPALAGLIGTGVAVATRPADVLADEAPSRRRALAPAGAVAAVVLLTVGYDAWLLPAQGTGLPPWLLAATIACGLSAAVTVVGLTIRRGASSTAYLGSVAASVAALLLVPAVASVAVAADRLGPFDTPFEPAAVDDGVRAFVDTIKPAALLVPMLKQGRLGAPDLMATQTSALAAPFIYVSGLEVLPIGGYDGTAPAPTLSALKSLVQQRAFHLVLESRGARDPRLRWIATTCRPLPTPGHDQLAAYLCGLGSSQSSTAPSDTGPRSSTPSSVSQPDLVAAALHVEQIVTKYPAFTLPVATLKALKANPTDTSALAVARRRLGPNYLSELAALTQVPPSVLAYLRKWGPVVTHAIATGRLPKPQPTP